MFYSIISTTYQKIGDLFCSVHISGLSHSVRLLILRNDAKYVHDSQIHVNITSIKKGQQLKQYLVGIGNFWPLCCLEDQAKWL